MPCAKPFADFTVCFPPKSVEPNGWECTFHWCMLTLLSLLPLAAPVLAPEPSVEVIDPQIVSAGIFRPGLAMIVREVAVGPGVHTYKLKRIPAALDNSLWFDSKDGATISDILTHFKIDQAATTSTAKTIQQYLANNVGNHVEFDYRLGYYDKSPVEHVSGVLTAMDMQINTGQPAAIVKTSGSISQYAIPQIEKLQLAGLKETFKQPTRKAAVDVVFKVKTEHGGHIRVTSLEGGAAWNASYRMELDKDQAKVTSRAQVAVAGLRLQNADVSLVAGMPDLNRASRLDLTTGLTSLNDWLDRRANAAVNLPDEDSDPYLLLAQQINQSYQYGGMGGGPGGFGGGGGMGGGMAADQMSMAPGNRAATESDRVRFIERAIQAARLEDAFIYPFGHVDLEPGERLTRDLSKSESPTHSHYVWTVNALPGGDVNLPVRRILSVKNTSAGPWPGGAIFLTRNDIPLAEVEMPFTSPGNDADIEMGKAEDLVKSVNLTETSRNHIDGNWRYSTRAEYEAVLTIQNTRSEKLPIDIVFQVLGDVKGPDGGQVIRMGQYSDWENPNSSVKWHFDLEPNEKKELHIKYSANI